MCVHTCVTMPLVDQILFEKALCPCSRRQGLQIKLRACCWNCFPWPACSNHPYLPSEGGITASHYWSSSILVSSGDSNSSSYTHLTTELSPQLWRVFESTVHLHMGYLKIKQCHGTHNKPCGPFTCDKMKLHKQCALDRKGDNID